MCQHYAERTPTRVINVEILSSRMATRLKIRVWNLLSESASFPVFLISNELLEIPGEQTNRGNGCYAVTMPQGFPAKRRSDSTLLYRRALQQLPLALRLMVSTILTSMLDCGGSDMAFLGMDRREHRFRCSCELQRHATAFGCFFA